MITSGSKRGQVYCYLKLFGKLMNQSMNRAISRGARAPKKKKGEVGDEAAAGGIFFVLFHLRGT